MRRVTLVTLVALSLAVAWSAAAQNAATAEKDSGEPSAEPVIVPPVLQQATAAVYPARAQEEGISASVVLEIDIDAEGNVEGVSVLTPATPPGYGFDEAAQEAAFSFVFSPATENGVPIPVRITYRYDFTLSAPEEKKPVAEISAADRSGQKKVVNFEGVLKERGTRLPLAGVTVTIFRGEGSVAVGYEALTDAEGKFSFYNLEPGDWMVLAESDGYYPLRTSDTVEKGRKTTVEYFIERGEYNAYDVTVEGEQLRKEVSKTTLDIEVVEKVPGTFGDVLTVVQNLPGVARTGPAAGNIVVRGSSPEDTLIFIEGVNVPIIYHFGGLRSVVPLGMLDSLDFYPGNFSSSFGRATGGIVDVRLKRLAPLKVGGYLDVNLADSGAYLEVPIGKKAAVAGAFRRSYIDAILNAAVPASAGVNLITAPRYYDYQLLGTVRPNEHHELTAFFFGSDDELKILFDNPANLSPDLTTAEGSTSTSFYRTLLQYRFAPFDNFNNTLKVSAGRNEIYVGAGDQVYLDLDTYVAQVYDRAAIGLGRNVTLATGIDYLFTKADAAIKFPALAKEGEPGGKPDLDTVQFTSEKDSITNALGTFLELEARLFDRWTVVPGVRFDWFSRVGQSTLAPRFNTRVDVTDQWTAKAGVGAYHKEPSFDETAEVFGNPDLGLEKAMHYSAGFEFRPLPFLTLDVTGFFKTMDDLVSRTDATTVRDGQTVPLNYVNGGEGRVVGLEVLLRHDLANNFTGWLSYTFSKAQRRDYGSSEWRNFDYDQPHILTLLGTYNLPRNWSIGFRFRVVSGSPTTPREGSVYSVDDAQYEPVFGKPNSVRLPVFHQLDVRLDKRWVFENWMLTAYMDVQNLYNSPNVTGYAYNYDSSQKRPRQGLPLLPIIGIKGEF